MSLVFETEIRIRVCFDAATDDAVIWADDDGNSRFRLVIKPAYLIDKYHLAKRFDHDSARSIINDNWEKFRVLAQDARDAGDSELVLDYRTIPGTA